MEAIVYEQVTKQFGKKMALCGLNVEIQGGQVTALLGPNGAGKTTAVSILLGLIRPTAGAVYAGGAKAGDRALRSKLGAMLQESPIADGLSVRETLQLFRSYYDRPLSLARLLQISGLENEANRRASKLSGGQKRRLAFAAAMAGDPDILVLDEPTTGMDVESRIRFWDVIRVLADQGKTILLTTHYLEEADAVADRIVVIADGRLIADGTPQQLKAAMPLRTVSFRVVGATVAVEQLLAMPGVTDVHISGEQVRLMTEDSDKLLPLLLRSGLDIADIQVQAASLETVFQQITHAHMSSTQEA